MSRSDFHRFIVATQYEVRSTTLAKLIASNKALHKALRKALHKALHKALRKALRKVLHKALHKALRVYGVPTSPRSADLPSGEAEAGEGRVATSHRFIVSEVKVKVKLKTKCFAKQLSYGF